jgi:prepilin-type N-terminal cleavage/methylation domain-containing protein
MPQRQKGEGGFSLIELLIVVTILGIIAALAIVYAAQAQEAARGASAVSSLRTFHSSEYSYHALSGTFADRTALATAGFLNDPGLRAGRKSHYDFDIVLNADPSKGFSVTASPSENLTLRRHYFIDESGVIRGTVGSAADVSSPPLQ